MSRGNLSWLLIVPSLLLAGLLYSYSAPPPDQDYQMVRTVIDVLATVDQSYYRALSPEEKKKLVEDMINGGLHSLDDHSQYYNESALERFDDETHGEFGGVGIIMAAEPTDAFLTVASPLPGTPAYDAGIAPGDIILKVDGQSTEGMTVVDARKIIKGKPGTSVTFSMLRGGSKTPEDITLTRALIEQHAVIGYERLPDNPLQWDYFPDKTNKIAMIRLETFNGKTTAELKAALEQVLAQGARGLILDLRGNGGGLLTEAIDVSSLFLRDGIVVSTRSRDGTMTGRPVKDAQQLKFNDKSRVDSARELPMAVLIDRMSASASEIVAAAMQDHDRAVVIGERSYGKGSVQKVFLLPPDEKRAVKLTAETWWTPKGRNIHRDRYAKESDEWGVLPNQGYVLKLSPDEWRKLAILRKRIDVVPGKIGVAPPLVRSKKPEETLPEGYQDPVIAKALEFLKPKASG